MKPERQTPPIRRVMKVSTGTTLEWQPRADGGIDLGVGDMILVALTPQEFEWFLDDLKAMRPPGPVYRELQPGVPPGFERK